MKLDAVTETLRKYFAEEITIDEANKLLEENGSFVRLSLTANVITEAEKAETVVDVEKGIYTGWAMVNHGVGKPDKMEVVDGKLKYPMGVTGVTYVAYMNGHKFHISDGETLVLVEE